MTTYIDTITSSLANAADIANGLANMKAQTIQNKLRQAELLNRMGENGPAEELLNQANHYGLSSILAPRTEDWTPEAMFGMPKIQIKSLNDIVSVAKDTLGKGEAINMTPDLAARYNSNTIGMGNPKKAQSLLSYLADDMGINANTKVGKKQTAALNQDVANIFTRQPVYKSLNNNEEIKEQNREAKAYNDALPKINEDYRGNEVDQVTKIVDNTQKVVNYWLGKGKTDKAIDAFNKGNSLYKSTRMHYQHDSGDKGLNPNDFFPKTGGGTGAKYENYTIKTNQGDKSVKLPYGYDPDTAQGRKLALAKLNPTGKEGITFNAGAWNPLGSDSSYMNTGEKIQADNNKIVYDQAHHNAIDQQIQRVREKYNIDDWDQATKIYNQGLKTQGLELAYDPTTGQKYTRQLTTTSNTGTADNTSSGGSYQSLYLKGK